MKSNPLGDKIVVKVEPIVPNRFNITPERKFVFGSVSRAIEVARDFSRKGFLSEVVEAGEVIFSSL